MDLETLETAFKLQAGACRWLDSPFYGGLMDACLEDVRSGGVIAGLLDDWSGDPLRGFLPLRLFGAVHRLVLGGDAPELAGFYPTTGGDGDAAAAWPVFRRVVESHAEAIRPVLERFPQTNEVRRCAGLLGGFLEIVATTHGLPLRLREIGCSAGLNLQWSRFAYALGEHRWGDAESPVRIEAEWRGPAARFETAPPVIESRAGCDIAPRSIADDEAVRALESYVWGDQPERLEQLRGAIEIARADPPRVDHARADAWLADELAACATGAATVLYHSSVWIYVPVDEQQRIRGLVEDAGRRADADRPLAWLRHEDSGPAGQIEIRLQTWPGGEERVLGRGHPHGRRVEWLAEADRSL